MQRHQKTVSRVQQDRIPHFGCEFLLYPQLRTQSGTVPGTFRNTNVENEGTNEAESPNVPHPETGIFRSQTTQNHGPEVGPDLVKGVQEVIRYRPHVVTGIQEDIPHCSLGTSSGKQKKARSTSQPPFRSESNPAAIEADQILLALQQLASNSNSANINNNNENDSQSDPLPEACIFLSQTTHNPDPEVGQDNIVA